MMGIRSKNQAPGPVRKLATAGIAALVMFAALVLVASVPAEATCTGCYASWGLYSYSNNDVTGRRTNRASETITTQKFHGALIDDSAGSCDYGGTQKRMLSAGPYLNIEDPPLWGTSRISSGANDWWLWTGGHEWTNHGIQYNVWVADTCQKAQNMAGA